MGIRSRSSIDRLRTYWTPEMDRYFIDLMLDQVCRGNRIDDHLFSKRAWKHMTTSFGLKFGFQYGKDVLKNRHKTLRNLYKAIKNLLNQSGFSWDETRHMVTSDNNVWDDYIKAQPDARSYRIKTVPFYSDLCLIYGNATTDDEEKRCKNANLSENPLVVNIGGELEGLISPVMLSSNGESDSAMLQTLPDTLDTTINNSRARTYWQPSMDRYFINLMLEQVHKGNQIDGLFRKQSWMDMIALFNARFGFKYDVDVLKNRYKTLRRQYSIIKNLLDESGFIWDEKRQMVMADDYVWQDYIKGHSDARQYMKRPVPYYKDLCVIYKDVYVDGRVDQHGEVPEVKITGALRNLESPATSVLQEDRIDDKEKESSHLVLEIDQLEMLSTPQQSKRMRRSDEKDMMMDALHEMETAVTSLADKRKESENLISIENLIEAVQAIPDIDEDLVLDACDFLEDEKNARTFLALNVKLRKKWLMRKLLPPKP